MVRIGHRPASRSVAIRLTNRSPSRCRPSTRAPRSAFGTRRRRQSGHCRATNTCSMTRTGVGTISSTSRVRCTVPPTSALPQSGQCSSACTTRWVGVLRRRAWFAARRLRGCLGPSAGTECGLRPGIPRGLLLPRRASRSRTRASSAVIVACCSAIRARRASRGAVSSSMTAGHYPIAPPAATLPPGKLVPPSLNSYPCGDRLTKPGGNAYTRLRSDFDSPGASEAGGPLHRSSVSSRESGRVPGRRCMPSGASRSKDPADMAVDLVLRRAKLQDGTLADIAVDAGRIVALDAGLELAGREERDLDGAVVLPGFTDVHHHL